MDGTKAKGESNNLVHGGRMGERAKISVILPVHDVEPYIGRCIQSLRAQTMRELEFIFVDDRSADGSMAAVEAWAAEDGRVRIIRNEQNLGPGPSRNRGIEAARGDYLSFVDPDDYVAPDFYELLYAAATSGGGHDIAKGSRCKVDAEGKETEPADQSLNNRIVRRSSKDQPLYCAFTSEHQSALYRKNLFADGSARYGASKNAEDTVFLLKCCYQTEDIVLEESATYCYVQREASAIRRNGTERTYYEIDSLVEQAAFLCQKGIDSSALRYLLEKVKVRLARFQELLGRGLASRDDYEPIAGRFVEVIESIPGAVRACKAMPQLSELVSGRPLTTPGLRSPGEGEVRVSVVLPVYDVGPHIGKCIESLRSQLLDGLEFVFVDDRGADGSMAAVEAWAAQDSRVRILRNERNLGPGPSRNRGIEAARGDYLSFVDPDDWVSPDFYELLYAAATAGGGHDMAKGLRKITELDGSTDSRGSHNLNRRIARARRRGLPLFGSFRREHQSALYRRALVNKGARYGTSQNDQDTTFLLAVTLLTDDVVFEEGAVYHYVKRPGSAVTGSSPKRYLSELDALAQKAVLLQEKCDDKTAREYLGSKAELCITRFYTGVVCDPSLADAVDDYAQKLEVIVNENPALRFLRNDSLPVKALCERRVLLPRISALPLEQKAAGAHDWVAFVRSHPSEAPRYMGGCAKAVARARKSLAAHEAKKALGVAYVQFKKSEGHPSCGTALGSWARSSSASRAKR